MNTYEITLKSNSVQTIEADRLSKTATWVVFYAGDNEVHRVATSELTSYGLKSAKASDGPAIA